MQISPPGIKPASEQLPCSKCLLLKNKAFRNFNKKELEFVQNYKSGEMVADAGTTLLLEQNNSAHLYTILSGWAFRYKLLEDGRRQILNFALPGDFIGLQSSIFNEMDHSVESLTEIVLCIFPREKLWNLYKNHHELAFDITWLAAREERTLDENLLSVGRRTAIERISHILLNLYCRLEQLGMTNKGKALFPFKQHHLADALGLSLVHTNKTLKKLERMKAIRWKNDTFEVISHKALAKIANYEFKDPAPRPFI
ncbi:MAG: Crp/Fnr family transcriptional regulator [Rhizobiales bacterium]|nr:Crp/Fnr family transcriptional regulator [Hyphomicrobiales bacterium]